MTTIPASSRSTKITLASETAGPFEVGFRVVSTDSLTVYVDGVIATEWDMSPGTVDDYTDAATITFAEALPDGSVIHIDGNLTPRREADYLNGDPGLVRKVNLELGDVWAAISEVKREVGRAARILDNTDVLPSVVERRGKYLSFDAAGGYALISAMPAFGVGNDAYSTVAIACADTTLVAGETVVTLGYYSEFDGGDKVYLVKTLADFQSARTAEGTPTAVDNKIHHTISGGTLVLEQQHNRTIDALCCGVREGVESGDAWNNAFWYAAAMSGSYFEPVKFVCTVNVLTSKTLHASKEPATAFEPGDPSFVEIFHPGSITAVGGGDFEDHLNAEMDRLTTLHGSAVTLGSALAAQFLKADPQVTENLGDKIERPLPLISFVNQSRNVQFGEIVADFWCSGVRIDRSQATVFLPGMGVRKFRKYGLLYTQNANNAIWTLGATVKQIGLSDTSSYEGRIMPDGYQEAQSRNHTGDCVVCLQKDMMWTQGWWGWARSACTLLDKCGSSTDDRRAGRTMYPDYFSRWSDDAWDGKGGQVNAPEWDRMAPSTGTGDCDFYSVHVMQGTAKDEDSEAVYRVDGLEFGGQVGWENWNSGSPAHVYGSDIDSSMVLCFGPGIRFYQPTGGGPNLAKGLNVAPIVRYYCGRGSDKIDAAYFDSNGFTIGVFPFDRGTPGSPDIQSYPGDYTIWNSRNRPDSGSYTDAVQWRGLIEGGSGNLPSSSVTTVGDYFIITEAGTYGGQAFDKGDVVYALTLAPGTSYAPNWYRGVNLDITSINADKSVTLTKPVNHLVARDNDVPVIWYTKPGGDMVMRLESAATEFRLTFDGTKTVIDTPDQLQVNAGLLVKVPQLMGYGDGAADGIGIKDQPTSRTTSVTYNAPTGAIRLFPAIGIVGTTTTFTVNCDLMRDRHLPVITQRSGTNKYLAWSTRQDTGVFDITFVSMSGTASDAPVFNFDILSGATS